MDMAKYAVTAVVTEGRSLRAVAGATGRSKSWVARQVTRFNAGGEAALALKKRGPVRAPNQTPFDLEDEIVTLRKQLDDEGWDAGASTIRYHLLERDGRAPARSTIHRVLVRRGFVVPQPQKRPTSSWLRFEADLPNERWQTDMTYWHLADGTKVEIVNFIDDYSRLVLASSVMRVATSKSTLAVMRRCVERWGLPKSLLSDNGLIFTGHYRGSYSALEIELATLQVSFKHGRPYHPQTQGKIERYHRTLKKWLARQPAMDSIPALQRQVDRFVTYYNEVRPHQARGCPPLRAWRERDKASVVIDGEPVPAQTRLRYDRVDSTGKVSLRYSTKLHHIGVGRAHAGEHVIMLVADLDVRVLSETGQMLKRLTLDPSRDYQR
jgi:transposase InsO family protein